jgi:hypothetical protein
MSMLGCSNAVWQAVLLVLCGMGMGVAAAAAVVVVVLLVLLHAKLSDTM